DDGSVTNAGTVNADSGSSVISNVNNVGSSGEVFTNSGTIEVTGTGTSLTLSNDQLTNTGFVKVNGTNVTLTLDTDLVTNTGGKVEVDTATGTLELKSTTINDGSVTNAGTVNADSGSSVISNVNNVGSSGEVFTNSGTIEVTGTGTSLTLSNDQLTNTGFVKVNGTNVTLTLDTDLVTNTGGKVEVDTATGTLELKSTTINDGSVTNAGTVNADSGSSVISNVNNVSSSGEVFTNSGTIEVTGTVTSLTLSNDQLTNTG